MPRLFLIGESTVPLLFNITFHYTIGWNPIGAVVTQKLECITRVQVVLVSNIQW